MDDLDPQLIADIDDVFLGWWPDDLMNLVRGPYEPGALRAYAHRDSGRHIPQD